MSAATSPSGSSSLASTSTGTQAPARTWSAGTSSSRATGADSGAVGETVRVSRPVTGSDLPSVTPYSMV